ncbi:zf-ZPR1-domain-containing protein [Athelia psychrophila]|uniref:Zf-ZPR1-domain-containing protein n=1 Tax=Athelia psychrophila TaxID=1759441 RepID=A0A166JMZ4_9AGAM|nr:zf-ZPR1-domain-containing protein [Fibularhizoctonia sp. CBS 109695]
MKCHEQGITRLLLTSIPYFKEVIVASFRCEHCGNTNNEIQSAGDIRPEGAIYTARILDREDLNRQLVRSSSCVIVIPEFELTLPGNRGQLTTVEGLIRDVTADLSGDQPLRRIQDEPTYTKIQVLIDSLTAILGDDPEVEDVTNPPVSAAEKHEIPMPPFTIKLDDPTGNSFIEFIGSMADPKWNMRTYKRTRQQNMDLGFAVAEEPEAPEIEVAPSGPIGDGEDANAEVFRFPGTCSSCASPLDTLMKKVVIPYFKDILIMSTNCDKCGYRDNEVKSGSAISELGKRITLKVEDREDLSRDILKSETCGLSIPEIDLVLQPGTLGGRFTTLEGILEQVFEELSEKVFVGDSAQVGTKERKTFEDFLKSLKEVKNADRQFTLIVDDPLANSYVQNLYAPDPDPAMTIETYERTWQQNEELGLNDMVVEGYGEESPDEAPVAT